MPNWEKRCSNVRFQKISTPTPSMAIGNSEGRGGGSQWPKILRESMNLNWEGSNRKKKKKTSIRKVWIFLGTTQSFCRYISERDTILYQRFMKNVRVPCLSKMVHVKG